jgi:hypothetical protein
MNAHVRPGARRCCNWLMHSPGCHRHAPRRLPASFLCFPGQPACGEGLLVEAVGSIQDESTWIRWLTGPGPELGWAIRRWRDLAAEASLLTPKDPEVAGRPEGRLKWHTSWPGDTLDSPQDERHPSSAPSPDCMVRQTGTIAWRMTLVVAPVHSSLDRGGGAANWFSTASCRCWPDIYQASAAMTRCLRPLPPRVGRL